MAKQQSGRAADIEYAEDGDPNEEGQGPQNDDGGSLDSLSGDNPREEFHKLFTDDDAPSVDDVRREDQEKKKSPEPEPEPEPDPEPQADSEPETDPEPAADQEPQEDPEPTDDDDIDLGVDLSDIEELDDTPDAPDEGFNPNKPVPVDVWKKIPAEGQDLIKNYRAHAKQLRRDAEADKPLAEYTRKLLKDAEGANVQPQTLNEWISVGLRAQQGDAEAIEAIGKVAVSGGFRVEAPHVDVAAIRDFLHDQIEDLKIDAPVAREILAKIKESVEASGEPKGKVVREGPENPPGPDQQQVSAAQDHAFKQIGLINERYQNRYARAWPEIEKRIKRQVQVEQALHPRTDPRQWVKLWAETAEKEVKAHVKRSKSAKARKPRTPDSESLGRGANVRGGVGNHEEEDPRQAFHREFTQ